jgi:hypothetical protein
MYLSRRTFLQLFAAAALPSEGLHPQQESGPDERFEALSLSTVDWPFRSLNPNDTTLLLPIKDGFETTNGYGLSWYMREEFRNFVLTIQWRSQHSTDNSGIFVRTPGYNGEYDDKIALDVSRDEGHEIQIDDRAFDIADKTAGHERKKTGAIYDLQAPSASAARPVGMWNTFFIICNGDRIVVILNGILVNDYRSFRAGAGFIALQSFGPHSSVQFRTLQVMRLR